MKSIEYTIRVTDPVSGKFVQWTSASLSSLKNQAKLEKQKGAEVFIVDSNGVRVYPK